MRVWKWIELWLCERDFRSDHRECSIAVMGYRRRGGFFPGWDKTGLFCQSCGIIYWLHI